MENTANETNFGIAHLWYQGDTVTHIVALILIVMSVGSWFIIISKILSLYKMKPLVNEITQFWKKTSWQEGLNSFSVPKENPFFQLAARAHLIMQERQLGANQKSSLPLANQMQTDDWLSSNLKAELDLIIGSLQKGLAFLASTGATAPFIGLFGTVWGIYHALMTIGSSGSASIDQVAGPIGEALVMTGLGLAVAIPAVLGYNALSKSNKDLLVSLRRFSDDLHTYLIQNERP
jgi:biopolymer transport protein ExbB